MPGFLWSICWKQRILEYVISYKGQRGCCDQWSAKMTFALQWQTSLSVLIKPMCFSLVVSEFNVKTALWSRSEERSDLQSPLMLQTQQSTITLQWWQYLAIIISTAWLATRYLFCVDFTQSHHLSCCKIVLVLILVGTPTTYKAFDFPQSFPQPGKKYSVPVKKKKLDCQFG